MSWLEFISSMTAALAWPLIVAAVLLSFRKAITNLLPDLHRLKAGPTGIEMEWERKLEEVREELEASEAADALGGAGSIVPPNGDVATTPSAVKPASTSFLSEIEELANVSPSAAVLEAYRRLEAVLRRAVSKRHADLPQRDLSPTPSLMKLARDDGLIRPEENSALLDLRQMRNRVAHSVEAQAIYYDHAIEYARLVRQLILHIESRSGKTVDDWQGPGAPP